MLTALWLGTYALVMLALAPLVLRREWVIRTPNLAMIVWHTAVWSTLSAFVWAVLVASHVLWVPLVSTVLHIDVSLAHDAYPTATLVLEGLLFIGVLFIARIAWSWRSLALQVRRQRRAHRMAIAALGSESSSEHLRGVRVLEHDEPSACCISGRGNSVIAITSGALRCLTVNEIQVVLAHERAHLRHRHQILISIADTVTHAFSFGGRLSLIAEYSPQIRRLSEMAADDVAASQFGADELVRALLKLSRVGPKHLGTLQANGSPVVERASRLLMGTRTSSWKQRAAVLALVVTAVASPAATALAPALHLAGSDHCVERCSH